MYWPTTNYQILMAVQAQGAQLNRIENLLNAVLRLENTEMISTQALTDATARETTAVASVLTMVKGIAANQADLAKQLALAIAANDPTAIAAVQKAIDDSATQISANADALAAAVVQNTPAA